MLEGNCTCVKRPNTFVPCSVPLKVQLLISERFELLVKEYASPLIFWVDVMVR